ncbi:uncharacterized protein LOC115751614 [Rhodamnia argentea]|uniref:Uncharacterized protein LOC115751614 n=1 Tax=Rhodamnia argentea TaxID=178133 RepID=A0A8B8QE59_9MYRT|nr:uncharacterized protein LOC115751614 [Rhodamnia argentea]
MAKRSDFAQKLLDDLRLRKERLATSQSSSRSHYKTGDAYGYSRQTYQGSTQNRTGALRSANTQSRSGGGQKLLYSGEASNQIVAFRRGQSSQQIGDLSMALALAFENGGKLRRMDSSGNASMLTFLQQIGRGSMELNQMERINSMDRRHSSTIRVPNLSQFHIKEISKGAQKLNQILRAWSNGANLDRYSMEIGKELLKGAMDLEESLRMLVNLEDASEFMTEPQRKNRLVLLDDDDDDNEGDVIKSTDQKQLVLPPRFSFDDPARRSRGNQQFKAIQRPGLPALTYPAEAKSFLRKEQTQSHVRTASHKRSTSFSNNTQNLSPLQEQANLSNSPQAKPEKGKISNVIAKLMGLEELPENPDTRYILEKDKSSNQTSDRKLPKTQGSTGNVEPKTRDALNLSVPRIRMTKPGKNLSTQDIPSIALGGEKRHAANSFRLELVSSTEKLARKETQEVNSETKKERTNTDPFNPNSGDQKRKQEADRRKDVKTTREERSAEVPDNKGKAYNDELYHMAPRTPRKKDFRPTLQEKLGYKERKLQAEKRNADVLFPFHPQKPQRDNGFEQSFVLQRPEPPEEKRMRVEMKSQDVKSKGSEIVHKTSPKPVQEEVLSFQRKNLHLDQPKPQKFGPADSICYTQADKLPDQSRPQNRVPRRVKSEPGKSRNSTVPVVEEKRILEPAPRARKVTEPLKNKMPRKLNEMKKKGGALVKPLPQASYKEGAKQIRRARLDGPAETEQGKTNKLAHREHNVKSTTAEASLQWLTTNAHEHQKEAEQLAPAYACDVDESHELEEARSFPYDLNQNVSSVILNDPHFNSEELGRDEELISATIVSEPADGTPGETTHTHRPDKSEDWDDSKYGVQEKLTECEKRLKHILMRSQLFLNTADALFKLDSPVALLPISYENSRGDDDKLILDCGYEIMKRKGRKQELAAHPFMKISVAFVRVRTLDDLVKQLIRNFNQLKRHGRDGNPECEPEYYVPKMLEVDVDVGDPDTNCMWDFGWNDAMSAFLEKDDVVRDVEKQVISGLIDEMTRDLLDA